VKVVSQADYDAEIARLNSIGQSGQLPNTLNREPVMQGGDSNVIPRPSGSK
jgi:hypothetical protein